MLYCLSKLNCPLVIFTSIISFVTWPHFLSITTQYNQIKGVLINIKHLANN